MTIECKPFSLLDSAPTPQQFPLQKTQRERKHRRETVWWISDWSKEAAVQLGKKSCKIAKVQRRKRMGLGNFIQSAVPQFN
ncbi:hypothetical protein PRIPAC_80895 [Pristionchus pacificus]|uniref:Uncharacterized protein n=1 Tax=Pristionchus pacificus TaxID=54126 RepID=A0A2A6BYA7_PRIPA|nr:hypothetical protein PRIPAC_80895 [Pristionchus pacificus]|eukprot:PDM70753.1 hypothetical protein PRIPAC_44957 [Pristionchus pacificus]